jgi:hypothetical protein
VRKRFTPRLSYANVMSTLAVFAVLGGGAWAAATIGANDIKRNAVRAKHIKSDQVRSRHVKDGSLRAIDFGAGELPAGPRGPEGPAGSAAGYGFIRADGTFDEARSKNLLASQRPRTGFYCLRFSFPVRNIVASHDMSSSGRVSVSTDPTRIADNCSSLAGANAVALALAPSGDAGTLAFFVLAN